MQKNSFRIIAIRSLSMLLMLLALVFGITWKRHGVCLGDSILTSLGLPAWEQNC